MRILVLGAGSTGGYFGGRLAEAGADVTFLVRPARARLLAERGLRIASPLGDAHLQVKTSTAETLGGGWDLVLLSCKAYDLDDAIGAVTPAVGPATTVLPLLNGQAHYRPLDDAFGPRRVLGGLCHIVATLAEDGTIRHMNTLHRLTFGERDGGASPRSQAIADLCDGAHFDTVHSDDVAQETWEKWAFVAALAAVTCLMRAPVGAIVAADGGAAIARGFYEECAAVAAAAGRVLRQPARVQALDVLTAPGSPITASMLRDLEAGSRIEGFQIVGDMLRRADEAGLAAPLLRLAWCHLQAYETRRN